MGFCLHKLTLLWEQSKDWKTRTGIIFVCILMSPIILFSFPLLIIKAASMRRQKRKLYEGGDRKTDNFRQSALRVEENINFVERMKDEQESIEVNLETIPQVLVLLLLLMSIPLQGQVLAGNQLNLYLLLIAKIILTFLKHSKTCINQMHLQRDKTLGALAKIVLKTSFFMLLVSRLSALLSCFIFSSLVPDLWFYHKNVIAWSNWTSVHPNYPQWNASTAHIAKEFSLPSDTHGVFTPTPALAFLPLVILLPKLVLVVFIYGRERWGFSFTLCNLFVPIKHVNMSTKVCAAFLIVFLCENILLLFSVHIWYGSGITIFLRLLDKDMALSYTSIVKFFYLLFPVHLPVLYLHGFVVLPLISLSSAFFGIALFKIYCAYFHLWKNVDGSKLLLISANFEETTVSSTPERSGQVPDNTLGTTAGHAEEVGTFQVEPRSHFVDSEIVVDVDALPDSNSLNSEECTTRSVKAGQDTTRPDPEGRGEDQSDGVDPSNVTPSIGGRGRARLRGGVKKDDLLDSNDLSSRVKVEEDAQGARDITKPGQEDECGGRGALEMNVLPTPSSGGTDELLLEGVEEATLLDTTVQPMEHCVMDEEEAQGQDIIKPDVETDERDRAEQIDDMMPAPSVVQGSSGRSQPASQQLHSAAQTQVRIF